MEQIKPFESIIALVSGFITIIGAILWLIPLLKYSIKKYSFQLTLIAAGIFNGILYSFSPWIGVGITALILLTITRGFESKTLIRLLSDMPSTLISKSAMYAKFCETIQRLCQALGGVEKYPGDDIRVSLFQVYQDSEKLFLIGRYPVKQAYEMPDIEYKIGQGTSGVCASTGTPNFLENLPVWEENEQGYIEELSTKFHIFTDDIKKFHRKSRCYYSIPILSREKGVKRVKFVISIDSMQPAIRSDNVPDEQVLPVITAYTENNKDMLTDDFIGS